MSQPTSTEPDPAAAPFDPTDPDFLAVYPQVTTVTGSKFRLRGGDPTATANRLESLFKKRLPGRPVRVVRI